MRELPAGLLNHRTLRPLRETAARVVFGVLDAFDFVSGRKDPLIPPRRLRRVVGPGDYRRIGDRFLCHLIDPGGLRPSDAVLDLGCGCGRIARPLTAYLESQAGGRYLGMDVHRAGIEWCRNNISRKYPHFQFLHMDIQNGAYNPEGRVQAGAVAFPLRDGSVDFLAAISLFSSMFPLDVPHYIEEMSRVLKPGGRLFLSLFLLDEKSRHALDSGRASVPFATPVAGGLTAFPDRPEAAVACEGAFVLDELKSHRLALEGGIHHGRWRGGPGSSLTHEDVLVAVRLSDRLIQ